MVVFVCFCFKQKTAYELRIGDWSSDVCSSDLPSCKESKKTRKSWTNRSSTRRTKSWKRQTSASASTACTYDPNRSHRREHGASSHKGWGTSRTEERRGGTEWVRTCRSRWSPYH